MGVEPQHSHLQDFGALTIPACEEGGFLRRPAQTYLDVELKKYGNRFCLSTLIATLGVKEVERIEVAERGSRSASARLVAPKVFG